MSLSSASCPPNLNPPLSPSRQGLDKVSGGSFCCQNRPQLDCLGWKEGQLLLGSIALVIKMGRYFEFILKYLIKAMKTQVCLLLVMFLTLSASLNFKLNHDGNADVVISQFDADKSGGLDNAEFIKFMKSTAKPGEKGPSAQEIEFGFLLADGNGDGNVNAAELQAMIDKGEPTKDDIIKVLIHKFDKDGDKLINHAELVEFLTFSKEMQEKEVKASGNKKDDDEEDADPETVAFFVGMLFDHDYDGKLNAKEIKSFIDTLEKQEEEEDHGHGDHGYGDHGYGDHGHGHNGHGDHGHGDHGYGDHGHGHHHH